MTRSQAGAHCRDDRCALDVHFVHRLCLRRTATGVPTTDHAIATALCCNRRGPIGTPVRKRSVRDRSRGSMALILVVDDEPRLVPDVRRGLCARLDGLGDYDREDG
jgi:hypothetical protein